MSRVDCRTVKAAAVRWNGYCVLLVLVMLAGCGQAEYEAKMDKVLARLKHKAQFDDALASTTEVLPGTNWKIRFPLAQTPRPRELTPDATDPNNPQAKMAPDRVQAPFLQLPGFQIGHEYTRETAPSNPIFLYRYLATLSPPDPGLADKLQSELAAAFPDSNVTWEDLSLDTPEPGQTINWKFIGIDAEMGFYTPRSVVEMVPMQGTYLLYLYEDDQRQLLIAWRYPQEIESQLDLRRRTRLSAGTLDRGPVPVAPSPPAAPPAAN